MPSSTRLIRRRIKSVTNTKKITKAMELVAASKMRRAVQSVLATRPYANLGWETILELSKKLPELHPLLFKNEGIEKILLVLITSDRGLCGGFNAQMLKKAVEFSKHPKNTIFDVVSVGKKGQDLARRMRWNMVASFSNMANHATTSDVRPVSALAMNDFIAKKYKKVYVAYTDFKSSLSQIPVVKQLLPLERDEELGGITSPQPSPSKGEGVAPVPLLSKERLGEVSSEFLFEPSPKEVLEAVLPRMVEVQVYQAILESTASEHSARMVAMKNATESAKDMIDDLVFTFNQVRQGGITREIAEISAGKAALE